MTEHELLIPDFARDDNTAQQLADQIKSILSLQFVKSVKATQHSLVLAQSCGTEVKYDDDIRKVLRHRLQGGIIFCPTAASDKDCHKGTAIIHYDSRRDYDPNDPDLERYIHVFRNATLGWVTDDVDKGTDAIRLFVERTTCLDTTTMECVYSDGQEITRVRCPKPYSRGLQKKRRPDRSESCALVQSMKIMCHLICRRYCEPTGLSVARRPMATQ